MRLLFILATFPLLLFSQNNNLAENLSLSEPYNIVNGRHQYQLIKDNIILLVKITDEKISLQKYDIDSKKVTQTNSVNIEKEIFEQVLQINGDYYLFSSAYNKKAKTHDVYYRIISFDLTLGNRQKLTSVSSKLKGYFKWEDNYASRHVEGRFAFTQSDDKSKFSIMGYGKEYYIQAFNSDFKQIWDYTYTETDKYSSWADFQLSNDGTAHFIKYVYGNKTEFRYPNGRVKVKDYYMKLAFLNKDGIQFKQLVENEEINIQEIKILETENNTISIVGYSNTIDSYRSTNIFFFKFDNELNEIAKQITPFSKEFSFMYSGYSDEAKSDIANYGFHRADLETVHITSDNNIILISEEMFYTEYSNLYTNIIISCVSTNGDVIWNNKIPKREYGYTSFKYLEKDNSSYLIYFNNPKNLNLPYQYAALVNTKNENRAIFMSKINNSNGDIETQILLPSLNKIKADGFENEVSLKSFYTNKGFTTNNSFFFETTIKDPRKRTILSINLE